MAKVTIVVPITGETPSIDECLTSISHQTLEDIEVLCLDASSDGATTDAAASFAKSDPRFRLMPAKMATHGELVNYGIQLATSEYVAFVYPTDHIVPHALALLCAEASDNELDYIKSDYLSFRETADKRRTYTYHALHKCEVFYNTPFCPLDQMPMYVKGLVGSRLWDGLYRTDFLKANNVRCNEESELPYQEVDVRFQLYAYAHRVMLLDEPLFARREGIARDSGNGLRAEYRFVRSFLDEHEPVREKLMAPYCLRRYVDTVMGMGPLDFDGKRLACEDLSTEFRELEAAGMLNLSRFTDRQAGDVRLLIDDPQRFLVRKGYTDRYSTRIRNLSLQLKQAQAEVDSLKNTAEYRKGWHAMRQSSLADNKAKRAAHKKELGLTGSPKLVVCLAWQQDTAEFLEEVVDSLLDQTLPADVFDLWLPTGSFPKGRASLPRPLLRRGGRVLKVRSHSTDPKMVALQTLKERSGNIVILAQDNIRYAADTLESLVCLHNQYPQAVCAREGTRVRRTNRSTVMPYTTWAQPEDDTSCMDCVPLAEGGVLYPPHSLDVRAYDLAMATKHCPGNLSLWLAAMATLANTPTVLRHGDFEPWRTHQKTADLHYDEIVRHMLDAFPMSFPAPAYE